MSQYYPLTFSPVRVLIKDGSRYQRDSQLSDYHDSLTPFRCSQDTFYFLYGVCWLSDSDTFRYVMQEESLCLCNIYNLVCQIPVLIFVLFLAHSIVICSKRQSPFKVSLRCLVCSKHDWLTVETMISG